MPQSQQYWLPGYGLSRHVVVTQIQFFLGPASSARPFSFQGREGYLITGTRLTRQQIEDLTTMSLEYEKGAAMRMAHNNLNFNTNGKSAQYINELVSFGPRDQELELPTDRKNDRERETERNGDRYVPSDRRTRQKQSW
ncbi:conserved hypothetical protein [Histoplasma capsulatum var. duboisii H88]|uniref:Uncharacterized protein n=2 Tax=Ajellomyces capsulatus TaxID=5037 RepID=C6HRP4_AJECH|nr:conserved hypothetical protein [Histoplasma capsulatum H143]EGC40865.1 conserved hypothetical protein [Histoplasma capsulatum var. duboisii H88]QSS52694.1 putative retrotransposable element [Histoplasma capsulatum var. duboisii H88]